jgi:hypothetical protein
MKPPTKMPSGQTANTRREDYHDNELKKKTLQQAGLCIGQAGGLSR